MPRQTKKPLLVRETAPAYGTVVAERGRLVLPSALRRRLAIKVGDHLVLTEEADGSIRVVRRIDLVRDLKGSWPAREGVRRSDALIAERRRDAAIEDGE